MGQQAAPRGPWRQEIISRWECHCQDPPVLLGTYDSEGRIHVKVRDRYWHIQGIVATHCPRCGGEQILDLRAQMDPLISALGGRS